MSDIDHKDTWENMPKFILKIITCLIVAACWIMTGLVVGGSVELESNQVFIVGTTSLITFPMALLYAFGAFD